VTAGRRPVAVEWESVEHAYRTQSGVPAPVTEPRANGVARVPPVQGTAPGPVASSASPH